MAGGYFRKDAFPEAIEALDRVAKAVGVNTEVEFPEARRARAAAYLITATEGAALHLDRLRAADFDPAVRDRLLAGAMVPSAFVVKAQNFRRWYRTRVLELFKSSMRSWRRRLLVQRRKSASRRSCSMARNSLCGRIWGSIRNQSPSSACRW